MPGKRRNLRLLWQSTLYEMPRGYRVVIKAGGRTVQGQGKTPDAARLRALARLPPEILEADLGRVIEHEP